MWPREEAPLPKPLRGRSAPASSWPSLLEFWPACCGPTCFRSLSEERFWHVLTFAAVLLVYSGVHFLKGNDLISVLVFGLTLTQFSRGSQTPASG